MKKINRKGFTLIELLAVIVILGVLLLVAIPAMTRVIENSKKDAFVSNAKTYIGAVRNFAIAGDYELPGAGQYTAVAQDLIELEGGSKNSSYNAPMQKDKTYIVIVNDTTNPDKVHYVYYYIGVDAKNNGVGTFTAENSLQRSSVKKATINPENITSMSALGNSITIDGKNFTKLQVYPAES